MKYYIHWGASLVGKLGVRHSALAEFLATMESDTVQNTGLMIKFFTMKLFGLVM